MSPLLVISIVTSILVGRYKNVGVVGGVLLSFVSPPLALAAVLLGSAKGRDTYFKRISDRIRAVSQKNQERKAAEGITAETARLERMRRRVNRRYARVARLKRRQERVKTRMERRPSLALEHRKVRVMRRLNNAKRRYERAEIRMARFADVRNLGVKGYSSGELTEIASGTARRRRVTGLANIIQKTAVIGAAAVGETLRKRRKERRGLREEMRRDRREQQRVKAEEKAAAARMEAVGRDAAPSERKDGRISLSELKECFRKNQGKVMDSLQPGETSVKMKYSIRKGLKDYGEREKRNGKGKTKTVKVDTPDRREMVRNRDIKKTTGRKKSGGRKIRR